MTLFGIAGGGLGFGQSLLAGSNPTEEVPHVPPPPLEPDAVRTWSALALEALGEGRAEIDAINVFPVADGDTGTNLHRTLAAAVHSLTDQPDTAEPLAVLARAALIGACGNSGTILAQLLYGLAESEPGQPAAAPAPAGEHAPEGAFGPGGAGEPSAGVQLAAALRQAANSAYRAVAHPVEGTMLTVASAAAGAAEAAAEAGGGPITVAEAAHQGACTALTATTAQLAVLAESAVVDAGAQGLTLILGALPAALTDPTCHARSPARTRLDGVTAPAGARETASSSPATEPSRPVTGHPCADSAEGQLGAGAPEYEVMYLLDADPAHLPDLRSALDGIPGSDSLVIGGAGELWSVHIHTGDAGRAIEAGIAAGRPHRIRVTHLVSANTPAAGGSTACAAPRALVAVVAGDGLAALCEAAGATVVRADAGAPVNSTVLLEAVHRTQAAETVLLPNDDELRAVAGQAASAARAQGVRAAVLPTRAAVQGIAALAVHEADRGFDEDVVAMTAAAGATRYGELTVAARQSWTMAGVCQAGDVLGLVDGDVAVIGADTLQCATDVLERMLAAGGEMVTLVVGADAPAGLAESLEAHVRRSHLAVDTVVYAGGQHSALLLIGVE